MPQVLSTFAISFGLQVANGFMRIGAQSNDTRFGAVIRKIL
jgi:hypothetical protein